MRRPARLAGAVVLGALLLTGCTTASTSAPSATLLVEGDASQRFGGAETAETGSAPAGSDGPGSTVTITGTAPIPAATPSPARTSTRSPVPSPRRSTSPTGTRTANGGAPGGSGLDTCELGTLPPEVTDTVDDIEAGGPYAARKDGSTFGNRERLLPNRQQGFYREYTVVTPGSRDRGARRVVTGGDPKTDPQWLFYTDDHYDSFCEITGR